MNIIFLGLATIIVVLYPVVLLLKLLGLNNISWWILLCPVWLFAIFSICAVVGFFLIFGLLIAIGA